MPIPTSLLSRSLVAAAGLALTAACLPAAQLPFSSYGFNIAPASNYPDSGGELTDGNTYSLAWGAETHPTYADVDGLVGWQVSLPTLTFNFATPVTITSVTAYFADSDGAAGVSLPATVTLGDGNLFSQTFVVDNPPGNGQTIASVFSGFSIISDQITLTYTLGDAQQWTMLAEVQAFGTTAIPEPSSISVVLGTLTFLIGTCHRRRISFLKSNT